MIVTQIKLIKIKKIMILIFVLLFFLTRAVFGEDTEISSDRIFNIVLVIDGSGSMEKNDEPGNRYHAIELFLSRLHLQRCNVGAIVFDDDIILDTQLLLPMNSDEDRARLIRRIREAGIRGDTDIGGALLLGVEQLIFNKKDHAESIVILFTDGITDIPKQPERENQSHNNKDEAIIKAKENGIHIFGAFLNHRNRINNSEVFEIVRRSRVIDDSESKRPTTLDSQTGLFSSLDGQYVEIHSNTELNAVATLFVNWIKGIIKPNERTITNYYGYHRFENINVPRQGVRGLEIDISFIKSPRYILLTSPSGDILHYGEIFSGSSNDPNITLPNPDVVRWNSLSVRRITRNWDIVVRSPQPGPWQALLFADPHTNFEYGIALTNDVIPILNSSQVDGKIRFTSNLAFEDKKLRQDDYIDYSIPILRYWTSNNEAPIDIDMMYYPLDNHFDILVPLSQENNTLSAIAIYRYGHNNRQELRSRQLDVNIHDIQDPGATGSESGFDDPPLPQGSWTLSDTKGLFIILGLLCIIFSLVFSIKPYRHVVWVEKEDELNEYIITSKYSLTITGTLCNISENIHKLSYSPKNMNDLRIAKIIASPNWLLPVLKKQVEIKTESDGVDIVGEKITHIDQNDYEASLDGHTQSFSIWYKTDNVQINKENNKNTMIFFASFTIGILSLFIGILIRGG